MPISILDCLHPMSTKPTTERQVEAFRRFLGKLPHGKDVELVILKAHLLIEEQIRQIVDERLKTPAALRDARLTFHQAFCLAQAFFPVAPANTMTTDGAALANSSSGASASADLCQQRCRTTTTKTEKHFVSRIGELPPHKKRHLQTVSNQSLLQYPECSLKLDNFNLQVWRFAQ